MNYIYITDEDFINTVDYKEFMRINSGSGNLKIRAYAASEALPVSGIRVIVSTIINSNKVIFFEGVTDASGMIEDITLPAPKYDISSLEIPNSVDYEIDAISEDGIDQIIYHINMYDGICAIQNINYTPNSFGGVV